MKIKYTMMNRYLTLLLSVALLLSGNWLYAQQSPNTVKFKVTYNSTTQTYTAWAVPDYATPNSNSYSTATTESVSTAQFSLKVPYGFEIQNIVDINGTWDKAPPKYGTGLPLTDASGAVVIPSQDYSPAVLDPAYAYYAIGKSPTTTNMGTFVVGQPVALFTFQGNGCFGPIEPLPPGDPFIQAAADAYSFNVPNNFNSASGQPSNGNQDPLEQYLSNTGAPANCATFPPVVTPDIANTSPGKPVSGNVLTNDTDPQSGTLTASVTTQPTTGTVTMSPTGSYTYTPPTGFTGVVTFCYTATNTAGLSASTCVTINVLPDPSPSGNNPPVANNDATQTTAGTPVTVAVLANDTDPDSATSLNGQLNNPTLLSQPSQGTAVVNPNGTVTYTPPASFTGVVTFPYQVCDRATPASCTTALVTVNVQPTPPANTTLAPVAVDDALLTKKDTPATGTVASNDSDPQGLPLTYTSGQPTSGTVVMSPTGSYTYTPAPGYTGPASFTYSVCNTANQCDVATVSVTVQSPVNPPVIVPVPVDVDPGESTTVCMPIADADAVDSFTASICSPPSVGTATVTASNSPRQLCVVYTAPANGPASTSVCVQVCDSYGNCQQIIVPIIVNPTSPTAVTPQPPAVVVVPVVTPKDTPVQVCMPIRDPNTADTHTVTVCGNPTNGTATASVNNTTHELCISYTPTSGSVGQDAMCVIVCDPSGQCTTVTVPITVVDPVTPGTTPVKPSVTPVPIVTPAGTPVIVCTPIVDNVGDTHTATLCGQPASGTATVGVDNVTHALCVTYTPGSQPTSTSVCIQVCDQGGLCTTVVAPITVLPVNQAPIVTPDVNTFVPGTPTAGNVLTNDKDPEGGPLTASTIGTPPAGFTLSPNGSYTYTAPASQTAPVTVPIQVCDAATPPACTTSTLTLTLVTPPNSLTNDAPIALNDATRTTAGTSTTVNVLGNDKDPEGLPLSTPTILSQPTNGTAVVNPNGTISYTPPANFTGVVTIPYQVCDTGSPVQCATAVVTVNVDPTPPAGVTNVAPVAIDDALLTTKGTPATGTVASNDSDPNVGQTLTFTRLTSPTNGTVVFNADGSYAYTPAPGYVGTDNFVYQVCDNGSPVLCTTATAYMTVSETANQAPVVTPDVNTFVPGTPTAGNVLTNDKDPEGTPLTASVIGTPPAGFTLSPNGSYTYTAPASQTAPVTVPIQVCDAATPPACTTSMLTLTPVTPPNSLTNDAPIALNDATRTTAGTSTTVNVLGNDKDPEGLPLSTPTILSQPTNGTASIVNGQLVYTPPANFTGVVTIPYQVCDTGSPVQCATAVVTVNVDPTPPAGVTNVAPVAIDDALLTTKGTPATGTVASNDSDPNVGQTLTFTRLTSPTNGTVVFNADGSYAYTPAPGYVGTDNFVYQVCDNGSPVLCTTATAYMTVSESANQAPVVTPDIANTKPGTPVSGNVLTNDRDPQGQPLTVSLLSQPTSGTVVLNPDGSYTYTPPTGFTGVASFCYAATNTAGLSASTCVTINVNPDPTPEPGGNDRPIPNNDATQTTAGVPVTIAVLANDTDPNSATSLNGQLSNPILLSQPSQGTAVVNANGTVTYTPPAGFTGVVTIPYQVCDQATQPLCGTALVTVNVQPTPPANTTLAPVAVDDALLVPQNTAKTGTVASNDADPQGLPLSYTSGQPTSGTVVMSPTGSYTYTPAPGYTGPASFTYSVCNTANQCDVATVSILVQPTSCVLPTPTFTDVNGFDPTTCGGSDGYILMTSLPLSTSVVINYRKDGIAQSFSGTSDANGTLTIPNLGKGVYSQFSYQSGTCSSGVYNGSVTIGNGPALPALVGGQLSKTNPTACGTSTGSILINGLTAGQSYTISYSKNGGALQTVAAQANMSGQISLSGLSAGSYSGFAYQVATGCQSTPASTTIVLNDPSGPVLLPNQLAGINPTSCGTSTGSIAISGLTASASYTLVYSKNGGAAQTVVLTSNTSGIASLTGLGQGSYQISSLAVNNCTSTQSLSAVVLTDPAAPVLTSTMLVPTNPTSCGTATGSFSLTGLMANAAYTLSYQKDGAPAQTVALTTNGAGVALLTGLTAGSYSNLVLTSGLGCASTPLAGPFNLSDPVLPAPTAITLNGVNPSCTGNNGRLVLSNVAPNQTFVFHYLFGGESKAMVATSNASGVLSITGLASGTYTDFFITQGLCKSAIYAGPIVLAATCQAPIVTPDIANTKPGTPVSGNVLTNDRDPQGQPLTVSLLSQPTSGTVVLNPDGSYTYTPPTGFTGVASFCYAATNTAGLSASTCVTINVNPDPTPEPGGNDRPIPNNDATQTTAGVPVTIAVLANDTDPNSATSLNGQLNNPTLVSQPSVGTAVVNANGTVTYTPPAGFTGVVTIPYQVCDQATQPLCGTALVTVVVQPTPPANTTLAPVAVDDALLVPQNTAKTGTVAANDSDPQGLPLSYTSGQPTSGTVVMSPTGSYTYTPAPGYTGPASFTYSVCNTANQCDVATVSVLVQAPATPFVMLKLKVLLQGALIGGTGGLMRDDLRSRGFLPTLEPYTAMGGARFTHINGGGGETMPASVTAQNVGSTDAVVDWVFVELRDPSNLSAVVATRSALVQRDGDVVLASDGVSPLSFTGLTGSSFYVSVKHRNHLGAMTATAIPLSSTGTIVDFTTKTGPELWNKTVGVFNYEGWEQTTLSGKQALWAGDANHNGKVKYQGTSNDLITIFSEVIAAQGANNPNPLYNYDNAFGYYFGDVNMDGKVKYQGTSNDTSLIFTNVITNYQSQSPAQMNSGQLYNFDFMLEQIP